MQDTFRSLAFGLARASVLMYFLMAALDGPTPPRSCGATRG